VIHNASYPSDAKCSTVPQNASAVQSMDIIGNIEVETNVEAICGIAIHPAKLTQ
jgi:hypothetical protein